MKRVEPLPIHTAARIGGDRRRRWLVWAATGLLAVVAALGVAGWIASRRMEPWLRARIVAALAERFQARVELDGFHVWVADGLWVEGNGLRVWPPSAGAPSSTETPMIALARFRFHTPLQYKPGQTVRIEKVELHGLVVDLPPRSRFALARQRGAVGAEASVLGARVAFVVGRMECDGARLRLETDRPGRLPMDLSVERLRLTRTDTGGAMAFEASLTNPKPAGHVSTAGTVGPWTTADPGETSIAGQFRLEKADLGTIRGIAGTLDGAGQFEGTLRQLHVAGETRTPDFRLAHFGTALPLTARYKAIVDATTGDTWLNQVEARLGHSRLNATGSIVRGTADGKPSGREVSLAVQVDEGRIEDFLRLASRSGEPLLTGELRMKTRFDLPPGEGQIHERMRLKGSFEVADAVFTSPGIQSRIAELSHRGQGIHGPTTASTDADPVQSRLAGSFTVADGTVSLPDLAFIVPGATIALSGKYGIEGGTLDFAGKARLAATVSQMVGGWKGALLKPLDRAFSRHGAGTEIPLTVTGTREQPVFGADLGPFHLEKGAATQRR